MGKKFGMNGKQVHLNHFQGKKLRQKLQCILVYKAVRVCYNNRRKNDKKKDSKISHCLCNAICLYVRQRKVRRAVCW